MQSNKALLGFGWAAAELKQPKLALVPWMELAGRDAGDAAVLEGAWRCRMRWPSSARSGSRCERYKEASRLYGRGEGRLDESVGVDPRRAS